MYIETNWILIINLPVIIFYIFKKREEKKESSTVYNLKFTKKKKERNNKEISNDILTIWNINLLNCGIFLLFFRRRVTKIITIRVIILLYTVIWKAN